MSKRFNRSPSLIAVVAYKVLVAILLLVTAVALLFTLHDPQKIVEVSHQYVLEEKLKLIEWILQNLLRLSPSTLKFSAAVACCYAGLTSAEALGLWYQRNWAKFLVLGMTGISLPAEILELVHGFTLLKGLVFIANLAVFWYLLRHSSHFD